MALGSVCVDHALGSGVVWRGPWFGWHGCLTQAVALRDVMTECRLGCSGQERFMCVLSMMDMLACRGIGHALRPRVLGRGWFLCMVGRAYVPRGMGQVFYEHEKGIWWMPWRQEAMKDVARCENPGGAASRL